MDPLSIAGTGLNLGKGIVSLFESHPKDKYRIQANTYAYNAAMKGSIAGLEYLKSRSTRYGKVVLSAKVPGLPDTLPELGSTANVAGQSPGAWATQKAKDDAYAKAQSVAGAVASIDNGATGIPKNSGSITLGQPRDGSTGNVIPDVALAGVNVGAGFTKYAPMILLGITALWAFKYAKKMR